jgi:hypothetical protein
MAEVYTNKISVQEFDAFFPSFFFFLSLSLSFKNIYKSQFIDRFCDAVIRVPGYRSRGPGSITGATRFSERSWVWNGVHSAS